MRSFLKRFKSDESGASAAEYALILVVVGLAIVAAATALSGAIGGAMQNTADIINDPGSATDGGTTDGGTTDGGTTDGGTTGGTGTN